MLTMKIGWISGLVMSTMVSSCVGFTSPRTASSLQNSNGIRTGLAATPASEDEVPTQRRELLKNMGSSAAALLLFSTLGRAPPAHAAAAAMQDSLDIDNFLRTGMDSGGNMGVSSQAGKSRPQTGVILRDGSDVRREASSGNVFAEILTGTKANPQAVLVSFTSPWKLETGPVFDIECRDAKTGDGAFVAVTPSVAGKKLEQLSNDFFLERLFSPTGRFSFYGPPTDIKVKKSKIDDSNTYRIIEVTYSNLSQSTNAEIPRRAVVAATIPEGTDNAVLLVASATDARWRNGNSKTEQQIRDCIASFRATRAPKSNLKLRPKQRGDVIDFS